MFSNNITTGKRECQNILTYSKVLYVYVLLRWFQVLVFVLSLLQVVQPPAFACSFFFYHARIQHTHNQNTVKEGNQDTQLLIL